MSINNGLAAGATPISLPGTGSAQTPGLIVIHYPVTRSVAAAVNALQGSGNSYHVLIDKDGGLYQSRPFTRSAGHAGLSNWKVMNSLAMGHSVNRGSVGISLINMGYDAIASDHPRPGQLIYNPSDPAMQMWEPYTDAQVTACTSLVRDLIATYPIREVVGHHDVSICGKFDPGPLFDIQTLDALITAPKSLGFPTRVQSPDGFLNLRREAKPDSPIIQKLPNGTALHIRSVSYTGVKANSLDPHGASRKRYLCRWASIGLQALNRHDGFVDMKFLDATPLIAPLEANL
jgi:N-acetylmuramoyl-L-alanine amidase